MRSASGAAQAYLATVLLASAALAAPPASPPTPLQPLTVALPGPGSLLYLPIELAGKIGADRAEGVVLTLRFFGGGPQANQDLLERNSDFAASGMAALADQRAAGMPLLSVAALTRVPAYSLLVRAELKGAIKQISDLRGRVIGVKGHAKGGRSVSQMIMEDLLLRAGVPLDSVNFLPAGQRYQDQRAALVSGAVDALMGDEPFASRLVADGEAVVLADFHHLDTVRKHLGGLFLNSQVATREDFARARGPDVARLVRILRRTLVWLRQHSGQEIADALGLVDPTERRALAAALDQHKDIYALDVAFSAEQVRTTEQFFHRLAKPGSPARTLSLDSCIADSWAGRAP